MNIQTEHLDDHRARFTVAIEDARLEKAKRAAAKKIAKRVNIPGFRKGKAPYNILLQYGFESNILNDAVDELSQEIYRETIEQADDISPYGPGAWEDFKLEDAPTFIYTVPLQPTIELGDYQEIRKDYEAPEIDDEMVDTAMRRLQQQEALVEESSQPVVAGNSVTIDVHSEFADDAPVAEDTDADEDDDTEADDNANERNIPAKDDPFVHEHDAEVVLDPEDEPILPGFIDALVGANVDEQVEFELTIPEDDEDYEDVAGRKVNFHVTVKKIEVVTLPELNDEFAAKVTADEDEPLSLLELRMRMRENLETEAIRRVDSTFGNEVLDEIVSISTVSFPEAMVEDRVNDLIRDFDQRLRQQGMSIDAYLKVSGMEREQLEADYRDSAITSIKRSLVLGEVVTAENLKVKDSEIEKQIDNILSQFGDQAEGLRSAFDTPQMRESIVNDVISEKVFNRIIAIAKGEEIVEEEDEDEADDVETATELEAEATVVEGEVVAEVENTTETEEENAENSSVETDEEELADETSAESDTEDETTT